MSQLAKPEPEVSSNGGARYIQLSHVLVGRIPCSHAVGAATTTYNGLCAGVLQLSPLAICNKRVETADCASSPISVSEANRELNNNNRCSRSLQSNAAGRILQLRLNDFEARKRGRQHIVYVAFC
jgi:hypothetical protein